MSLLIPEGSTPINSKQFDMDSLKLKERQAIIQHGMDTTPPPLIPDEDLSQPRTPTPIRSDMESTVELKSPEFKKEEGNFIITAQRSNLVLTGLQGMYHKVIQYIASWQKIASNVKCVRTGINVLHTGQAICVFMFKHNDTRAKPLGVYRHNIIMVPTSNNNEKQALRTALEAFETLGQSKISYRNLCRLRESIRVCVEMGMYEFKLLSMENEEMNSREDISHEDLVDFEWKRTEKRKQCSFLVANKKPVKQLAIFQKCEYNVECFSFLYHFPSTLTCNVARSYVRRI